MFKHRNDEHDSRAKHNTHDLQQEMEILVFSLLWVHCCHLWQLKERKTINQHQTWDYTVNKLHSSWQHLELDMESVLMCPRSNIPYNFNLIFYTSEINDLLFAGAIAPANLVQTDQLQAHQSNTNVEASGQECIWPWTHHPMSVAEFSFQLGSKE